MGAVSMIVHLLSSCRGHASGDPASAGELPGVVGVVEARDLHDVPGVGRLDEPVSTEVDGLVVDVAGGVAEEDEVARLQRRAIDGLADRVLVGGDARERDARTARRRTGRARSSRSRSAGSRRRSGRACRGTARRPGSRAAPPRSEPSSRPRRRSPRPSPRPARQPVSARRGLSEALRAVLRGVAEDARDVGLRLGVRRNPAVLLDGAGARVVGGERELLVAAEALERAGQEASAALEALQRVERVA